VEILISFNMEPKAEKKSDKTAGRHRSATVVSPSRTHKESSRTNGSGASPPESRRRAPTQVSASDLVLAFERKILRADDKDKRLTEAELASLYSKETLKVAPSKRKKGSPLNSLFGGPKDDNRERSDDLDPQGTAPSHDNWSTLDIAKKERRVKSILERRTSMMVDVENMLNSTRPRSRTVAVRSPGPGSPLLEILFIIFEHIVVLCVHYRVLHDNALRTNSQFTWVLFSRSGLRR
jgi:hypothetical protein